MLSNIINNIFHYKECVLVRYDFQINIIQSDGSACAATLHFLFFVVNENKFNYLHFHFYIF